MASVTVRYSALETSAEKAKKLSNSLYDYAENLEKKVRDALDDAPGKDDRGYIAAASTQIRKKTEELNSRAAMFSAYASDVTAFIDKAESADKQVAKDIKATGSSYVGERNWFQAACDWVYNTIFVDWANSNPITRFLVDCSKKATDWIGNAIGQANDWFKHGDGKYIWNIVSSVVAVVAAVAAVITAAAAVIGASGIALVIGAIALAAAIVGGIITTVNSAVKLHNNCKALGDDNPGVSRYLGDIGGMSDAIAKYDMGDQKANDNLEFAGDVVDTTKVVCDVVGITTSFVNLGAVKSSITGRTTGYKFSKDNMLKNFRASMGFDFDVENKYTFKGSVGTFGFDTTKTWYVNKNGYGGFEWLMNRYTGTQTVINTVFTGGVVINNVMSTVEKSDKVYSKIKGGLDFSTPENSVLSVTETVFDISDALGKFKLFSGINKVTVTPYKTIDKIHTMVSSE